MEEFIGRKKHGKVILSKNGLFQAKSFSWKAAVYQADHLISSDQIIRDGLAKGYIPVRDQKCMQLIRLGIKSWLADMGLALVTPFWTFKNFFKHSVTIS